MKRYYAVFTGRVQGVGFRWVFQRAAVINHYTGWVRNLDNGNVDCEIQGEDPDITEIIRYISANSRWIDIHDYAIKEIPAVESEKLFRVK